MPRRGFSSLPKGEPVKILTEAEFELLLQNPHQDSQQVYQLLSDVVRNGPRPSNEYLIKTIRALLDRNAEGDVRKAFAIAVAMDDPKTRATLMPLTKSCLRK
jgi:hypothetical protein